MAVLPAPSWWDGTKFSSGELGKSRASASGTSSGSPLGAHFHACRVRVRGGWGLLWYQATAVDDFPPDFQCNRVVPTRKKGDGGREGSAWGSPSALPVFTASSAGRWKILQPGGEQYRGFCQQQQPEQTPWSILSSGICSPLGVGAMMDSHGWGPQARRHPRGLLTFGSAADREDN